MRFLHHKSPYQNEREQKRHLFSKQKQSNSMVLCFQLQMRSFFLLSNNPSLFSTLLFQFRLPKNHRPSETFRHTPGRRIHQQPIKSIIILFYVQPLLGIGQTRRLDSSTALIRVAIAEANSTETRADIALVYCSTVLVSMSRLKKPSARPACSSNRTSRHVFAWCPSWHQIGQI